ncbi:MAG: nucleotide sugar dehydrogenase [Candidatus Omnitrophica bacterium]|nr:nucleotide sugar dehydrogenase [Candidatus Omnitrophota bacterium]
MISKSPYGDTFKYEIDDTFEREKIDAFLKKRKTVVVQGLGFVGSAMVAALALSRAQDGSLRYNVIGVDLPDEKNFWKIARINNGVPPVRSFDKKMDEAYAQASQNKNVLATYSPYAYSKADVVVIDIHLDIKKKELGAPYEYEFSYDGFKTAIETVAQHIVEDTLVIIETTVPPGTTEQVVYPLCKEVFSRRGLDINKLYLAHSGERVMPGTNYLDSIVNFYRVYSGINSESKIRAREFFESFVNTRDFPITEMHSPTASEMVKVLENSYRAVNIAFIQEWTEFAEEADVNLFEVVKTIRKRPTHQNIMWPGFGVGGYCLTKDALLADWAYRNLFNKEENLGMSLAAIGINDLMPEFTFELLQRELLDDLNGKYITILGVSYLNDVADTRSSPTQVFYEMCENRGGRLTVHDPLVSFWPEKQLEIDTDIKNLADKKHDIAVFAVRHHEYVTLSAKEIREILPGVRIIIDANNVLTDETARELAQAEIIVTGVGKGHWNL